jgi:putative serine protease PepD
VVFIQARVTQQSNSPFDFGGGSQGVATGSGFVLDKDGDILTNAHVVEGAGAGDVTVRFGNSDEFDAKVVGRDPSSDLALLKVNAPKNKLKPLNLGDSGHTKVGDPVVAIGNPFGFDRTVTTGIVSALQRQIQAPNGFSIDNVIQTDASINPGNSGGPLLDASGRVIGINSQIATGGSSGSVGIGFAIPINSAKSVISQLKKSGNVEHAYIGITTAQVTKQIAHDLNLPTDHGALVQQVVPGGPGAKAGLHAGRTETTQGLTAGGDLIIKVAGKDIRRPDDVAAAIQDKKPGDQIPIVYIRGGQQHTANVTLGKRPNKVSNGSQQAPQSPDQGGGGGGGDTFPLP